MSRVYTPETLAKEWSCSRAFVESLIASGELAAFKIGPRMFRIRGEDVDSYEGSRADIPAERRDETTHSVYFIRCEQFVKIGMTRNVGMRLATLQAASPFELVLLASEPGYVQREAELHAMFADLRVRGEWFRHEGRLASYITSLSSAEPPE